MLKLRDTAMLNYVSPLELDFEYIPSVTMMGIAYLELAQKAKAAEFVPQVHGPHQESTSQDPSGSLADEIEASGKE